MELSTVYLVTVGETRPFDGTFPGYANPGMADEAMFEINRVIQPVLPPNPPLVICGTGHRHMDLAKALGFQEDVNPPLHVTAAAGVPDMLTSSGMWLLSSGKTRVCPGSYTTHVDLEYASYVRIFYAPDNTVICTDVDMLRGIMHWVTLSEEINLKPGTLYRVIRGRWSSKFRMEEMVSTHVDRGVGAI